MNNILKSFLKTIKSGIMYFGWSRQLEGMVGLCFATGKDMEYGEMLRAIRVKKEITLRELAVRSGINVANLSRIERGTTPPPQSERILDNINRALELDNNKSQEMKDQSAIDNKQIPKSLSGIKGVPLFIKTVAGKRLTEKEIRKITKFINKNY